MKGKATADQNGTPLRAGRAFSTRSRTLCMPREACLKGPRESPLASAPKYQRPPSRRRRWAPFTSSTSTPMPGTTQRKSISPST